MPFAEAFINAFLAGQQAKESKEEAQRKQRRMVFEEEDRGIEKEMLQHRMKQIKIQERLQARQAAAQNLELLSGIPMNEVTPDMTEGGVLPARSATGDDSIQTLLKELEIPGIEELGIGSVKRRPMTLESQLGKMMAEARIKEMTEIRPVARGGVLTQGGREIFRNPYTTAPQAISKVDRDASGNETQTWITPEQALGGATATRARLPQRPSTVVQMPAADINATVAAVKTGRFGPEDIQALGVRDRGAVLGQLAKDGFDLNRVRRDAAAIRTHYNALNTGERQNIRIAADVAEQALQDLEDVQAMWQSGGHGVFSKVALAAAKSGTMGADAKQKAADFEAALDGVRSSIAVLRASGSNPSNTLLDAAARELDSGTNIGRAIAKLKKEIQHRVAAIGRLEAITPSSVADPNLDVDVDDDPAGILR